MTSAPLFATSTPPPEADRALERTITIKRRTFLQSGAIGVAGLSMPPALAHYEANGRHPTPGDLGAAVSRLRKQFLAEFAAGYIDNVIVPHFLVSTTTENGHRCPCSTGR
jgi:hypothetical protein